MHHALRAGLLSTDTPLTGQRMLDGNCTCSVQHVQAPPDLQLTAKLLCYCHSCNACWNVISHCGCQKAAADIPVGSCLAVQSTLNRQLAIHVSEIALPWSTQHLWLLHIAEPSVIITIITTIFILSLRTKAIKTLLERTKSLLMSFKMQMVLRFSRVCVCCAENSETQLGKDVKYKLLVRALRRSTEEELGQLVSASFTVRDLHCSFVLLWGVCTCACKPSSSAWYVLDLLKNYLEKGCIHGQQPFFPHSRQKPVNASSQQNLPRIHSNSACLQP